MKDASKIPHYVAEAIASLEQIMSDKHKTLFEHMMKTTKGESFVLKCLAKSDAALLPSELSAALQSSTARISAILRTLEKKGEVVRETDKANRRNILVTITEAGRMRAKEDMKGVYDRIAQIFIDMGESDTREFIRLTGAVFDAMQKWD
jgi:DNA-binding MarR family transcriptional regulator